MGFYRRWLFPRLCHKALSSAHLAELRRATLAEAAGDVLELGFGTGLNRPHFPPAVRSVTGLDPNPGMERLARAGLQEGDGPPVHLELGRAEALPFPEARFDAVVSTWTLCSVDDPARALAEAARVLRPGGRFLFLEHGLSDEPRVARWQRRLTPFQRRVGDGCHLDRDFAALLAASPLAVERLERFYQPKTPKIAGSLYRGAARPRLGSVDAMPGPTQEGPGRRRSRSKTHPDPRGG